MKRGDFVKISYVARVKGGEVFDTTHEDIAKREGIWRENRVYKPLPIVVGGGQVVKGLDEALEEMEVGEERVVEVPPEKGFGERDPGLVKLIPMRVFRQRGIDPVPGLKLEVDGRVGRIQTVSGGRVRVDFNPELAGKTLVYEVKVEAKAKTLKEKLEYLLERNFPSSDDFRLRLREKSLEIEVPKKAQLDANILSRKILLTREIFKFTDINKILFKETWER